MVFHPSRSNFYQKIANRLGKIGMQIQCFCKNEFSYDKYDLSRSG